MLLPTDFAVSNVVIIIPTTGVIAIIVLIMERVCYCTVGLLLITDVLRLSSSNYWDPPGLFLPVVSFSEIALSLIYLDLIDSCN